MSHARDPGRSIDGGMADRAFDDGVPDGADGDGAVDHGGAVERGGQGSAVSTIERQGTRAVQWYYLDHGWWISSEGALERLSATQPWAAWIAALDEADWTYVDDGWWVNARGERERLTVGTADEVDWTYVDDGWWVNARGERARLSAGDRVVIRRRVA